MPLKSNLIVPLFSLIFISQSNADNLDSLDCLSVQTRKLLISDINDFPALKNEGLSILDLSEPKTKIKKADRVVCNYLVAFSDGETIPMDVMISKNSLGDVIIEIKQ